MQKQTLTPADIIDYLRQNKDFFLHYPDILDELNLQCAPKNTPSLVERQLARQRHRIHILEAELEKFTQLAIQHSDIFLGLLPLQQQLSQAHNLADGINQLNQWVQRFDLQQAKLLLFTDSWYKAASLPQAVWLDRHAFDVIRLERFGLRRFYLGQMSHKEKTLLFLPDEFPIGSVACCLLGTKTCQKPTALLLFSARDARHFHNGQDTVFLTHLVDIIELHLRRWVACFEK